MLWLLTASAGELPWQGQWTQGGLIIGQALPGTRMTLNGQPVKVGPDGAFGFGFSRDAPPSGRWTILYPDGGREDRALMIAQRQYNIQRLNGLPPDKVTPPPAVLERIRRENARVDAARQRDIPQAGFLSGFAWPVIGRISGVYGSQRILNGEPRQPHFGVDIARGEGEPIRAPQKGIVRLAERDMYFTGGTTVLDHGHGITTSYLHQSRLDVAVGDTVEAGQVIGLIGKTGRATGPHLCWRMNWFQERLDPQLAAGEMPG